jgi:hypothetical protein
VSFDYPANGNWSSAWIIEVLLYVANGTGFGSKTSVGRPGQARQQSTNMYNTYQLLDIYLLMMGY